jgi:hypothetical protein
MRVVDSVHSLMEFKGGMNESKSIKKSIRKLGIKNININSAFSASKPGGTKRRFKTTSGFIFWRQFCSGLKLNAKQEKTTTLSIVQHN